MKTCNRFFGLRCLFHKRTFHDSYSNLSLFLFKSSAHLVFLPISASPLLANFLPHPLLLLPWYLETLSCAYHFKSFILSKYACAHISLANITKVKYNNLSSHEVSMFLLLPLAGDIHSLILQSLISCSFHVLYRLDLNFT